MKVLKFGGSSVGSISSLKNVKSIVESTSAPRIIVVSALGGITDKLISTAKMAVMSDPKYRQEYSSIRYRHVDIIETLVPEKSREELYNRINPLFNELADIYQGIFLIKDLSQRTLNIVVSYGERLSSLIISYIIDNATLFDSREFIKTHNEFGHEILETNLTNELVKSVFTSTEFSTAIVPGFISSSVDGSVTNLGRGGSDYTASIIAAALNAETLEIWTDVDGFMTADPRVINTAYVIDKLSFVEAMELCNFGAKVIYPPTIYPVFHKNIPLRIKNTFNPQAAGTLITSTPSDTDKPIKGISSINDTCLITVTGLGMVGIVGINARIFNALARNGVSVFLVSQASSENNTSLAVKNADAELAVEVLSHEFKAELEAGSINSITPWHNLATVAIVGENMKGRAGIAGKLFNTLGKNGINVIACAQGASEVNISFVIDHKDLKKALNVIHDSLFLSETQVLNLFIVGIGNVGKRLLGQISKQHDKLLKNKSLEMKIVGISNSRKCIFDREGIDINNFSTRLEDSELTATPENIKNGVIKMNIYNPVFVDCTASKDIAALYSDLLEHNVNIVAANKIAASSPYDNYLKLKEIAHQRDIKFLFETNVGAGLPIISTINNMINSGDTILKIEAVVSGTLNYIFDVLSKDVPFSKAVKMARELGYSEPDPRIDLCGSDVVRKIVILAREAGYRINQEDVKISPFLPKELFTCSEEEFFKGLPEVDEKFETMRKEAESQGKRFRFIATLNTDGTAEVGLKTIDTSHPFYFLESSNNIIAITTDRYNEYPIIIKGYGAGAEVTAAGVFADIINIANIR